MTYNVSQTQRLPPGQTWTITDGIGLNIISPADGSSVVSFNNAGTILITTSSPYIVAGINYDYGSLHQGSVFTNEATGVFRLVSTGGANMTIGLTGGQGYTGWNGDLVNHGIFEIDAAGDALGVLTGDITFAFTNTGRFAVRSAEDAWGVLAHGGGTFTNHGLIDVIGHTAVGLRSSRESEITNSGTIRAATTGTDGWSIGIGVGHSETTVTHIVNTGRIEAQYAILDETAWSPPQAASQIVINSGQIVGVVDLARGDDQLINPGSITGEVWLGYGADLYDGRGGSHAGAIHGGFGDDVLTGGDGADVLFGEDGDDTIHGGGGADFVQGGRGDNVIDGGAGSDTLVYAGLTMGVDVDLTTGVAVAAGRDQISGVENVYGSRWADILRGGSDANLLFGGDGDDTLDGRDGADTLAGGAGSDRLTGGGGNDSFRFGLGDGADVITDLSAGDRVIVHGYSAWAGLVQSGADTRVVLSDTDSILLLNMTVAAAAAQISFASTARPAYVAPGDAPELLGDSHIEIRDRFHVREGETVALNGANGGFAVYGVVSDDAGVTNGGLITSTGTDSNGAIAIGLSGFANGGEFNNLASGVLRVLTTHAAAAAHGVIADDFGASVVNAGLIEVRGVYSATGLQGLNIDMSLHNTGVIHVESEGRARGADLHQYGDLLNHGLIEVIGSGDVVGIRSMSFSTMINHGVLTVENRTGDAIGIQLLSNVFSIVNTGLITADRAIDARGYSPDPASGSLDNSGEIRGVVSLSGGADRLVNTGLIDGEIRLNEGDDVFDGSGGRQTGPVYGGWGRDLLMGGADADHLVGEDYSDTLIGGAGDDLLDGGAGDDFVSYAGPRSAYSWTVDGDTITLTGPDGVDTLKNVELLRFSAQLISLTGFGIRERGLGDDDTIVGSELNDVLDGGPVPYLWEMQGSTDNGEDRLFGLAGNDILTGGGRNDHLDGGQDSDQLDGGLGDDVLLGGAGDDVLIGGRGSDRIDGGAGLDIAVFTGARADYVIATANGMTIVTGPDGQHPGNDTITLISNDILTSVERLRFSDQTVVLRSDPVRGTAEADIMVGGAGDDVLSGGDGADRLAGAAGDDELHGGPGHDVLDGGLGYDTVLVEGALDDYRLLIDGEGFILKGQDGSDRLIGVEMVRFSEGGEIDLARLYGGDGPQTLPPISVKGSTAPAPDVSPLAPDDDAFILKPGDDDQPQIQPALPDALDAQPLFLERRALWFEAVDSRDLAVLALDYGVLGPDDGPGRLRHNDWDLGN